MHNQFTITVTGPDGTICQALGDDIRAYLASLDVQVESAVAQLADEQRERILQMSRPRVVITTMDKNLETKKRAALNAAVVRMERYNRQDLPEKGAELLDEIEGDRHPYVGKLAFVEACKARGRGLQFFVQACRRLNNRMELA